MFHTFKSRIVNDKLSSKGNVTTIALDNELVCDSAKLPCAVSSRRKQQHSDPPRLEILSELPSNTLHRSSTFRNVLEKAADEINDKYGSIRSLPGPNTLRTRSLNSRPIITTSVSDQPSQESSESATDHIAADLETSRIESSSSGLRAHPQLRVSVTKREQKHCNRIPIGQIDRILEQSLHLRDLPESDYRRGLVLLPQQLNNGSEDESISATDLLNKRILSLARQCAVANLWDAIPDEDEPTRLHGTTIKTLSEISTGQASTDAYPEPFICEDFDPVTREDLGSVSTIRRKSAGSQSNTDSLAVSQGSEIETSLVENWSTITLGPCEHENPTDRASASATPDSMDEVWSRYFVV